MLQSWFSAMYCMCRQHRQLKHDIILWSAVITQIIHQQLWNCSQCWDCALLCLVWFLSSLFCGCFLLLILIPCVWGAPPQVVPHWTNNSSVAKQSIVNLRFPWANGSTVPLRLVLNHIATGDLGLYNLISWRRSTALRWFCWCLLLYLWICYFALLLRGCLSFALSPLSDQFFCFSEFSVKSVPWTKSKWPPEWLGEKFKSEGSWTAVLMCSFNTAPSGVWARTSWSSSLEESVMRSPSVSLYCNWRSLPSPRLGKRPVSLSFSWSNVSSDVTRNLRVS